VSAARRRDGSFHQTRHELVESVALLRCVERGELDALEPPVAPLDILAQQIVAEVSARGEVATDELFDMVRRAAPFRDLPAEEFNDVLDMASRAS
jgi:ATP-dependent Lhr-like helicase